ncbi:MAG TPA: MFS transporter, partial [Symbiobacteriaceae bacterium]|nr:MFS transporter [Symbiobacteriaceae bacterium]
GVIFLFNAASFLVPAGAMLLVRLVEPVAHTRHVSAPALASTWAFLRDTRGMAALLAGYGGYMLGMWSVNTIFFPYTYDVLQAGTDVVGWSISAYFGAFTVTGFVLERWGRHLRNPRLLFGAYLGGALVWAGYAFTRSVPLAILLSAFDGIVYTYAVTLFETRIQEDAPPETRGRIFGVIHAYDEVCTVSGKLLGGALAGTAGILPGIRLSAGLTAGLVALVMGAAGYYRRQRTAEGLSD